VDGKREFAHQVVRIILSIVFGVIGLGLGVVIHIYLWRRLVRDTGIRGSWRKGLAIAGIGLGATLPITFVLIRLVDAGAARVFSWPAFLWMALTFYAVLALLVIDAGWLIRRSVNRARKLDTPPVDASRREFFARVTGGAAVAAAGGVTAIGMASALSEIEIVEVEVALPRLPKSMDGFVIGQITDLHVGFTVATPYVQGIVDRVNSMNPDMVALTGDLVDGSPKQLAPWVAPLGTLRSRHGSYFVTGNHEYLAGADDWLDVYRGLGMRVLRNERVEIRRGDDVFDLAGVDDYQAKRLAKGHGADLGKALAGRDTSRELVLLAHQPREVHRAKKHGVGLQLSGHTHGGQIWPWHYLVMIQQGGLLAGKSRHGDTWLYTSRGCGYWGPPVRVGAPPEITKIILRSGRA